MSIFLAPPLPPLATSVSEIEYCQFRHAYSQQFIDSVTIDVCKMKVAGSGRKG